MGVMRSSDETGGNPILRRLMSKPRHRKKQSAVSQLRTLNGVDIWNSPLPRQGSGDGFKGIMFDVDSAKAIKIRKMKTPFKEDRCGQSTQI